MIHSVQVTQVTSENADTNERLSACGRGACSRIAGLAVALALATLGSLDAAAQTPFPEVIDPNLGVRRVVSGLVEPTTMVFLGSNDFLVLEKSTGRVMRVVNGVVQATVLDLAVNSGSERGLLGSATHPDFPENPRVYLYWTASSTGSDTAVLSQTPLLGNRVDSYIWNGKALTFEQTLIRLHALQPAFAAEPSPAAGRGNHNGGVIKFGPDKKLYIFIGDNGRHGQLQNLPFGPFGPGIADDQFGGPQPDNAHLTGVILRLNDDGSTPSDNPFFAVGAATGERSARISRRSSPTVIATASAWTSTRSPTTCGSKRTATTPSPS